MKPFQIKVLGGTFTVEEIVPQADQSAEAVLELIRTVSPDRWFVLLSDQISDDKRDTLAVIGDDFEFQVVAAGKFQGQ